MRPASGGGARGDLAITGGVTTLAVVLMAWDHLWGNQGSGDAFPVDPLTFVITIALIGATALVILGATLPRAVRRPETVHRAALVHSCVALVLTLPAAWLGFPTVVAGGGVALGSRALAGPHRRSAAVAVVIGTAAILLAILATAFPAADGD